MSRVTTLPRPAAFACANCGPRGTRHRAHGLCAACAQYRHRTGQDRPAWLAAGGPRRCLTCHRVVERGAGRRCFACAAYRLRTGRERPAALYQRRREGAA